MLQVLIEDFPKSFTPIVESIGVGNGLRIVELAESRRLFVPSCMSEEHPISLLLGVELATMLSSFARAECGDRCLVVEVPTLNSVMRMQRARLRRDYIFSNRDLTVLQVSKNLKVSQDLIYKTLRKEFNYLPKWSK